MGTGFYVSTNDTWNTWTSTTTTVSTGDPWVYWAQGTGTSATTTKIWVTWTNNTLTTATAPPTYYQSLQETEEQRVERQAQWERVQKEQKAAETRAEDLLWSHLSDDQRSDYRRSKSFEVVGCHTKRRYRVHCDGGVSANVHELDDKGERRRRLCAHIGYEPRCPTPDHFLAQKLFLERSENDFLHVARDHGA